MLDDLKNSKKTVGVKQSIKAVEADNVKVAYIASDADEKVIMDFRELCSEKSIEMIYVDSMKQLGKSCGIEVGASVVCLLK